MEKLSEKKNFGIPATLYCVIAYLIGYLFTRSIGGEALLVAAIFAAVVFAFNFDDKVKNAVKQAYIIGFLVIVIDLCFDMLRRFAEIVCPKDFVVSSVTAYSGKELKDTLEILDFNGFQSAMVYIYKYGLAIFEVVIAVLFLVLLIAALFNKEIKIGFINNILDGKPAAPVYQQQMYQQPNMQQPNMQQPNMQQPQQTPQQMQQPQSQVNAGTSCSKCGKVNLPGAAFCASCGNKLS